VGRSGRDNGSRGLNMDADDLGSLRIVFRSYKRSASKLKDGAEQLAMSGKLQFNMSWKEGEGVQSSFDEQPPLVRFAALLRPFMARESPLELDAVWSKLLKHDLVDDATREGVERLFATAANPAIAVVLNDRPLAARDIYDAYAEGRFFAEDPEAKRLLEGLSVGPMPQMVAFLFHSTCVSYSRIVFAVLQVVLGIERSNPQFADTRVANPRCIYCLRREGDFDPEEHVIPEAFGNDELVLRDAVCRACNNELSKLDQFLAEFEALGLLRVMNVGLTKKGKFPRAKYRDFVVEKVKPRELRFTSRTNRQFFATQDLSDGTVRFSLRAVGRKRSDIPRLGRSLFKIGLGLVAHDRGSEYACDGRFDAARDFIFGRGVMPNYLWMSKKARPTPSIGTIWHSIDGGTVVVLDFFGVRFAFNLEPTDFTLPEEAPDDQFAAFWLGVGAGPAEAG
jgi:hypothetical protein